MFIPPNKYIFLKYDLNICILLFLLFSKIKSFFKLLIKLYFPPYGEYIYIVELFNSLNFSL